MKIQKIETIRHPEHYQILWVRLHTSEGVVGLGETFHVPGAVESFIHDYAAGMLLGESVFDREKIWMSLFSCANFFGFAGAEMRAISAIDIALWDAIGKYLNQPIYNLIGGRTGDSIPVYNTCVDTPRYPDQDGFLNAPGDLAESLIAQGFKQMKVWPWDWFAPQMGFRQMFDKSRPENDQKPRITLGPPGHYLSSEDLKKGLKVVEEIRGRVGNKIEIAIEGHSRWDMNCALRIAKALEPYDVVWIEDIVQPEGADDLARLVHETRVPQAVSERLFTKWAFKEVLKKHSAHVVLLDVNWTGGLTESVKISTLADVNHLPFSPHDCAGPVLMFANLHLCAGMPNAMIVEVVRGFIWGHYQDLLDKPVPIKDGRAWYDDLGPGLGADLRPEVLDKPGVTRRVSERT